MDASYLGELTSAERETSPIDDVWYGGGNDDRKRRGSKRYSVLSSYLKNRPLKVLRSIDGMNG